jgi:hypothetical protein
MTIIHFPRASARPAENHPAGSSHSRQNYPAGLSFRNIQTPGMTPGSAAGGTRQAARRTSSFHPRPHQRGELEVHFLGTAVSMFLAGCLTVAILTVVML